MILVLSKSRHETSTDEVISWLIYFNVDWNRINGIDFEKKDVNLNLKKEIFTLLDEKIDSKRYPVIWYRRWHDEDSFDESIKEFENNFKNKNELLRYLYDEMDTVKNFLFSKLKKSYWLTNPLKTKLNKLIVLEEAKNIGLLIPDTYVLTQKVELIKKFKKHNTLITKSLSDSPNLISKNDGSDNTIYTEEINIKMIENLPENFFPTLFQRKINKIVDLRIFYLDGVYYPMAIFSQKNNKTKIDFRHYDYEKPNRAVPYKLPSDIESKLNHLMKRLQLNCVSIDMVLEKEYRKYFFLEVNPVGQFGMISSPCNYFLEKKIAVHLIKKHRANVKS